MTEYEPRLIDRLQERGLIDRYGFLFFASVGAVAILAAKHFSAATEWVAIGAIALMILYALIVNMRGTGKLRSDQAGDNCYYLGLIYTLTSLAYAIFTFDPEDTATTIVQGFGIALATTIVGLVLRVFFNQSRVDLYEMEETARLELTEAAARLKSELSQIALEFKDFAFGLQQSVSEIRDEAKDSINASAQKSVEVVETLANRVSEKLGKQADELEASVSDFAKKTGSVTRSLERHNTSIDKISEGHELVLADVGRLASATEIMVTNSKAIMEQTEGARQTQGLANELLGSTAQVSTQIRDAVTATLETIRKFEGEFAARLKELEDGPKQATDKVLAAIAAAANSVEDAMRRLTSAQEQAVGTVDTATSGLLTTVRSHNSELERELSRSREYVQQVHRELVEMTTTLNDKLS
jgi:methyl-accepting chemotaxis protein